MDNSVIFAVISLLIVTLIYGSVAISSSSVFAAGKSPRDVCDLTPKSACNCYNGVHNLKAICCTYTSSGNVIACEQCDIDIGTGDYYNCQDISPEKSPTTGTANVPQGGGAIEQPPTPKKHGGIALPKGGGLLEQPSTDQGTIQSPPTNNKLKGSDLGQIGGAELATKKGKSPTPTPPPCPTDNSPIPPNCTLKPKF